MTHPVLLTQTLVEIGAVLAVAVPLMVLASRALRALPAEPAGSTTWSGKSGGGVPW